MLHQGEHYKALVTVTSIDVIAGINELQAMH